MRYVDAGYAAALGTVFVYAISLVVRRRRWEHALRVSNVRVIESEDVPPPGGRS